MLFDLNELMDSFKVSVLTYNFLLIVECFQILFFAYQNTLWYMWENQPVKYSLEILNYIQAEKILEASDNAVKLSLFYILMVTVVALYAFIAIVTLHYDNKERHNRTLFKYSVKLCCFFLLLHNTIFTIPAFQIIFNMIICTKNSKYSASVPQCYQGVSLLNLILAILTGLLLFVELIFANLFLNEMNPSAKLPSASFNINQNLLKVVYKIFFCLFTVMDYTGLYRQYIVITGAIVLFINLVFFRLNYPPLYNNTVNKLSIFIDTFLTYMYFIIIVQIVCSYLP